MALVIEVALVSVQERGVRKSEMPLVAEGSEAAAAAVTITAFSGVLASNSFSSSKKARFHEP